MTSFFNFELNSPIFVLLGLLFLGVLAMSLSMRSPDRHAQSKKAQIFGVGLFQSGDTAMADAGNLVNQLTNNALWVILGVIAVFAVVFMYQFSKDCADLSRPQKNSHSSFFIVMALGIGLCAPLGSCTAAQRARAADFRAAQEAERCSRSVNQHIDEQAHAIYTHNP
jgi:hypothetical protein